MKFKLYNLGILLIFIIPWMFTGLVVRAHKVCGPHAVTRLNQRPIFAWYMAKACDYEWT